MDFEIKKFDAGGRLGIIEHNGKKMQTPNLFPVVSPIDNLIPPQEIIDVFGGKAIFTNAYILYKNSRQAESAVEKGIHDFLKFKGLIATDSGAFQQYMYGNKGDITAEEIEIFQERIGSDFPVILDLPVQLDDNKEIAEYKVAETIRRAKENISRRKSEKCAWFGPIHGGKYLNIVKRSCLKMNELNFGIYAIGGVVKSLNNYMYDLSVNIIMMVRRFLRPDRPLHLFGAGLPQFFSLSIACGVDLMDSAAYILFAKQGRYFTLEGTKNINNLTELPCNCPICSEYSAREIQKLFKQEKVSKMKDNRNNNGRSAVELIARHNLYVSFGELRTIREAIREGTLWGLVEQRIHSHPKLIRAYKQIPKYWPQLEMIEAVEKPKAAFFFGEISNSRPIIYRIIKKVFNDYSLSEKRNIILLPELDCSIYNSPTMKEWINHVESINNLLYKRDQHENCYEIIIISNIFGPLPHKIISIYPMVQREWEFNYYRSNWEIFSILKYQDLNPQAFFRFNGKKIQQSQSFMEFMLETNNIKNDGTNERNSGKLIPEFRQRVYNINEEIIQSDIINRIEISMNFFKKLKDNIKNLTIIRPRSYISDEGYERSLSVHLLDDIIQILDKNQDILNKNTSVNVIQSIEDLDRY
ncbi:MAG: tRNA guanosine(15) transglycosylase TgtA [Promethearchaeota archaeon]